MSDVYRTIGQSGEGIYTEKRSKFLAFAHHVADEEEVKRLVQEYKKKYFDARHVCYAYVLGVKGDRFRSNDDGEPSGSAGKPILGQLNSFGVTFTLVVVIRYFGGVKLGTGGLAVAYKVAASEALNASVIVEKIVTEQFVIKVPYPDVDTAMRFIKEGEGEIVERNYTATSSFLTIRVRTSVLDALCSRLKKLYSIEFIQ